MADPWDKDMWLEIWCPEHEWHQMVRKDGGYFCTVEGCRVRIPDFEPDYDE